MSDNSGFINLPMKELIEIPIRELVTAQGSIALMTADYIKEIGLSRETYYRVKTSPITEMLRDSNLNYGSTSAPLVSTSGVSLHYQAFKDSSEQKVTFEEYLANNFDPVSVDDSPETYETRNITFSSQNGEKVGKISAPILSMVPIPSLLINDASLKFDIRINSVTSSEENSSGNSNTNKGSGGFFRRSKKSITGTVANNKIRNNSQQIDSHYSFQINLKQTENEGLAKLLELLGDQVNSQLQTEV